MFAALDARRLLEVEEDRDAMILTRVRIEPLIEVANVRFRSNDALAASCRWPGDRRTAGAVGATPARDEKTALRVAAGRR